MTTETHTMTVEQALTLAGEIHRGTEVDEATVHPYSGALTLSHKWQGRSYGRVIIDPDGTVTYRAPDITPACTASIDAWNPRTGGDSDVATP